MGLWIKNADGTIEKAAGGGGGGGPHDHADYALVEHDHDEFTHDHDYLPLAGGTLTGGLTVDTNLQVDGQIVVEQNLVARASVNFKNVLVGDSAYRHLWMNSNGWLCVADSTRGGPFAPSKLARNSDVLERAETATLPPEPETDEDGNQTNAAEVEAHDTVELFDVVTALLAKVKQLSAEIEELKKGA